VEQASADRLHSRHKIRPTTAAGYEFVLQSARSELGHLGVQDLTRRHMSPDRVTRTAVRFITASVTVYCPSQQGQLPPP
jgi:hypothetical protein